MRTGINYKAVLLCATPVAICALGTYYYYRNRKGLVKLGHEDSKPKTPLQKAVALKDKGNKYFKGSKYKEAIDCYTEAIEACPENSNTELATFYQNRAAAKENLSQIESAIEDCTLALKYCPRYLKALNRRAKLYERISQPYLSLLDATALTIFESFSNVDNVMFMEKILNQLAGKACESMITKFKYQLPTNSFIRNYLSAFYWDPILCEETELIKSSQLFSESASISHGETFQMPYDELKYSLENMSENNLLRQFLSSLSDSVASVRKGDYEQACSSISKALEHCQNQESLAEFQTPQTPFGMILIFIALANLLQGTFLALRGLVTEAHTLLDIAIKTHQTPLNSALDSIINDSTGDAGNLKINWSKHPVLVLIKINALIKKACLSMTADQDIASCLSAFQQAEQLCPQCPDTYQHRGQIYVITDQIDEALNDFNKSLKLNPNSSLARCQRTFASYRKAIMENDPERALSRVDEFNKLVNKYPECVETRSLYAQILSERCDFQEADKQFEEVLRLSPDSGIIFSHRAMMYLRWRQDRDEALKILIAGLEVEPNCGMLHELTAQIHLEAGNFTQALDHLNKAIELTNVEAELKHLLVLHTGAKAQKEVCETYGITNEEIKAWHLALQQKMMASMQMSR